MKIINICMDATFTDGYGYQDNLLPKYQKKLEHDVVILTSTQTRNSDGKKCFTNEGESVIGDGIKLIRIKKGGGISSFFGKYGEIFSILKKEAPDFIFIHGLASSVAEYAIKYKKQSSKKVKIVADNHQDSFNTHTDNPLDRFQLGYFRKKWKKWICDIDKIYGTTSWRADYARDFFGIPNDKTDVLLMGVDDDEIRESKEAYRKRIREELNIPFDSFVFISGGKLGKDKMIIESLGAFCELDNTDAHYIVFGSLADNIREDFQNICCKNERIHYIGFLDSKDIYGYLFASDFGVFPGGHSVLWEQSVGCSLPCLFRSYGEKTHLNICNNSIVVDKPSKTDIAHTMRKVLSDKTLYSELKCNSERASVNFSYKETAKKSVSE